MKKIIEVNPAFDRRHKDQRKNYGVHGVELRFVLKGRKGATVMLFFTDWFTPNVQQEQHGRADYRQAHEWYAPIDLKPNGADIGYHSKKPLYDWQNKNEPSQEICAYCDGQPCWYDGSSLRASEVGTPLLLEKGSDGVWDYLEAEYISYFGKPLSLRLRDFYKKWKPRYDKFQCFATGHMSRTCPRCKKAEEEFIKKLYKKKKAKQRRELKKATKMMEKAMKERKQ